MSIDPKSEPQEHGPEDAFYASDGFNYCPVFVCMCGWSIKPGQVSNWEDAGAMFDEHLEETDSA